MTNRRRFLGSLAFLAAAGGVQPAFGARRPRRRRTNDNANPPKSAASLPSNKPFAQGHQYTDADVEVVIPNLVQWQQLRVGMTATEVKKLLGSPLEGEGSGSREQVRRDMIASGVKQGVSQQEAEYAADAALRMEEAISTIDYGDYWIYGRIRFPAHSTIDQYQNFGVSFSGDKVSGFCDPFSNPQSDAVEAPSIRWNLDGRPTTPVLVTPGNKSHFDHFPFFVDYRWLPSCGVYPMGYILEVSSAQDDNESLPAFLRSWDTWDPITVKLPHHEDFAGGINTKRWRVKAKNRLGESDWSEYRYYKFQ